MLCDLTSDSSLRIEELCQLLLKIDHMTISKPSKVERFPHLTTVRRLTLESIPRDCSDWEWLKDLEYLQTVDVSVRGDSTDAGRFHAENAEAKLTQIREDDAVFPLVQVVDNLPKPFQTKVYLAYQSSIIHFIITRLMP